MKTPLTYATVCSGIECMSVAAHGLPLRPVFFSEIEPFPCAVLKARYPNVPNLGDMSKIQVSNNGKEIANGTTRLLLDARLDILAGGTPCQDVSVAGKRAGMAEGSNTRSSLAFDFVRLARELGPRYVIWENVAACIDSKNAPDFIRFLAALGDCGYTLAYRILDAQYVRVDGMGRAVPQRRRRVWVVGYSGADESRAAEILLEPDCVAGHTPPRRRTGQGFAYSLGGRDSVDAGLVGGAPGTCAEGQGGGGCLNPGHPQTHRVYGTDGTWPTLEAGAETSGQDQRGACIALDGDKLKPRADQRKGGTGFGVNVDGAGYTVTATDRHGVAYGIGNLQANQSVQKEGANTLNAMHEQECVVECFENHATDARTRPCDAAPVMGATRNGNASNNNPLVVHQIPFVKTRHASGKDGEGEKWEQCEVAGTRNTIEGGDGRSQECIVHTAYKLDSTASNSMKSANPHSGIHETEVAACLDTTPPDPTKNKGGNVIVSTNSNGEDVAPTLDHNTGSTNGIGAQNDKRGGYVVTRALGIGRDVMECGKAAKFAPDIREEVSPTLRAQSTTGGVCVEMKPRKETDE